jgi:MFS family permease
MVESFGVPHEEIPFYVGITFACFSFAQFLTGIFWGRVSDRFGRKPTMLMGLSGSLLFILIFGFSTTLPMAIFARCSSGLVNGNVGILRTMVAEMVPQRELQPRAFSVMPMIWTTGSILGPAIGGFLADPVTNHPNWFKGEPPAFLKKFPFCLPNLVSAALLVCGLSAGWVYADVTGKIVAQGTGVQGLLGALPDSDVGFALFRIQAENVGNVGAGIITEANIVLQWKGPKSSGMAKVKSNGGLQHALDTLKPNKGFIEVLGKANLNVDNIYDRWRPGSGSKVIQD